MNHDAPLGRRDLLHSGLASVRENWGWILASGAAFVILGTFALLYAVLTTLASVLVFGATLMVGGLFEAVHAFKIDRWGGFVLELLMGILYVVVGGLLLFNPGVGALSLTLLIAAFFLASAVFRIVAASALRPPQWGWLVVSGVVTLLLGILILAEWPVSGLWVIGLFVGIDMIFSGTWLTMLALAARRLPTTQEETLVSSAPRREMGQAG
ncbi:HdeD family acid-resistance protein [Candidatus Nitrospira bockiana]